MQLSEGHTALYGPGDWTLCSSYGANVEREEFNSSSQLCELQGKEVIYKRAELILCVANVFPFSCIFSKSPLLQKLILGEISVAARKALSLGGSRDNECHKLFLKT